MIWKSENQLEYKTYINRVYIYMLFINKDYFCFFLEFLVFIKTFRWDNKKWWPSLDWWDNFVRPEKFQFLK